MPLEVRPIQRLTYKLRLTPQMRLGISLLQMPLVKLKEFVEQEIEKNPLLEVENVGLVSKPKEIIKEYTNKTIALAHPIR